MKGLILFFASFVLGASATAQQADDIIGTWNTASKKARIHIYKSGGKYFGTIVWLKDSLRDGKPKTDVKNPDASKRNRPIVGTNILKDLRFEGGEWISGEIYDPESGKTYSCKMSMPDKNTLRVRGYLGVSLLGRTEVWKR